MDYFIIGVTNNDYFPNGKDVIRGSYPLCGQYPSVAQPSARHSLSCDTGLSAYRYLVAQQPYNGIGCFTICEIEAYLVQGD